MIEYTTSKSDYKTVRPGDPLFTFSPNGFTLVHRAGFELSNNCPAEYRSVILQAYQRGWLKPVAALRGVEATMETLRG